MTEYQEENRISDLYKSACDGIKAPEELFGKVVNMKEMKKRKMPKVAVAVIALLLAVVGSNGIVYAATGTGWIGKIMVSMFGEEKEMNFEERTNSNGEVYYIGTVRIKNGNSLTITTKDMSVLEGKEFIAEGTDVYVIFEDGTKKKIEVYDQEEGFTVAPVLVTPYPDR